MILTEKSEKRYPGAFPGTVNLTVQCFAQTGRSVDNFFEDRCKSNPFGLKRPFKVKDPPARLHKTGQAENVPVLSTNSRYKTVEIFSTFFKLKRLQRKRKQHRRAGGSYSCRGWEKRSGRAYFVFIEFATRLNSNILHTSEIKKSPDHKQARRERFSITCSFYVPG